MALGGTIRGKKISLRLPVAADLASYNDWMADLRVRHAHWVWHEPAMPATWKEWLAEAAKDRQLLLWSIEAEGSLVGLAAAHLWSIGNAVDLNHLVIDPDRWHCGYGCDAAVALHRFFFDYLDLRRVQADVRADNAAALRIADALGYVEYARGHRAHYRDGSYVDEVKLVVEKQAWQERWSSEREYPPLGPEALR
jgi:RimJ/RimL family protein N-acetyltransferase